VGSFIGGYVYEINNSWLWMILPAAVLFNFLLAVIFIKRAGEGRNLENVMAFSFIEDTYITQNPI